MPDRRGVDESGRPVGEIVEAAFRISYARIVASAARIVRDLGIAEELAQDALVAALEQWPGEGVPGNPGGWLATTARRRAIDLVRRRETYARKLAEVGRTLDTQVPPPGPDDLDSSALVGPVGPDDLDSSALVGPDGSADDDVLRLIFTACHPVLGTRARIALTLRLLGGLTTQEVARAYLSSEATVAQRIVRAKRILAAADVPFEVPGPADRSARLDSVLEVIYLIFNEGYAATAGDDLVRPALCEEALRLARVLQGLMPSEPEVHGLAALLEFQASRLAARTDAAGHPILLEDQDRARWNRLLIARGIRALRRSGPDLSGRYALQAAIAACHARAIRAQDTDWQAIAALYARLAALAPSPIVELNRAVAVSRAEGPAAGLAIVEPLAEAPGLRGYHLLPSVRADLLERIGRTGEARAEFLRAADLTRNTRERDLLLARAARLGRS